MGLEKPLWLLPLLPESTLGAPATNPLSDRSEDWTPPLLSQPFRPIGRADVMSRALAHLRPANTRHLKAAAVVQLWGESGLGKAAIARWVAHFLKTDYPDACLTGRWQSDMPESSRSQLLVQWLRQLRWTESQLPMTLSEQIAFWQSCLRKRRLLVWLEVDGAVESWVELIPQTVDCAVIITSRYPFEGVPNSIELELSPLSQADSITLLAQAAGHPRTATQTGLWAPLAELCDGIPLALELTGTVLQQIPESALAQAIPQQVRIWQRQPHIYAKHRAVAGGFFQVCQTLSPIAQTILYRASLPPTPLLSEELAVYLLQAVPPCSPGENGKPGDIAIAIQELINHQCLEEVRYGYQIRHDLIRFLAKAQLASVETRERRQQLRLAISRWYGAQLHQLSWQRHPQGLMADHAADDPKLEALPQRYHRAIASTDNWLDAHWLNILAVWEWTYQAENWPLYLQISLGLSGLLTTAIGRDVWPQMQQQIWAVIQRTDNLLIKAAILNNLANVHARMGEYAQAQTYYEESLEYLSPEEHSLHCAQVLANLGLVYGYQEKPQLHQDLWHQALAKLESDSSLEQVLRIWMQCTAAETAALLGEENPATGPSQPLRWLRKLFE